MSARIGLISDTHNQLRHDVFDVFQDVDLILHAGDVGSPPIITELETIAPVHAVFGNTDGFDIRALYMESLNLEVGGKRIAVTHGHLLGSPTPSQLRLLFPKADVIVYGHTHEARIDEGPPLVVNPGAAGPARFNLKPTVAILALPSLEVTIFALTGT